MAFNPSIHSDLIRQRELELRGRLARPAREVDRRTNDASAGLVELVQAARAGDPQAWESLVTRFSPMLRAVARDYRLSAADIDDAVQATWAAGFANIAQLREPEAISGWLCVTTRRQALRILRSRQLEIAVEDPRPADETEQPEFESALVDAEQHAAVHAAIDRLPDRQRSVVTALLEASAPSYAELSAKLRMPRGSIGPTRERALDRLRRDRRLTSALTPRTEP